MPRIAHLMDPTWAVIAESSRPCIVDMLSASSSRELEMWALEMVRAQLRSTKCDSGEIESCYYTGDGHNQATPKPYFPAPGPYTVFFVPGSFQIRRGRIYMHLVYVFCIEVSCGNW